MIFYRVQNFSTGESVEWSTLTLTQIFKDLSDRDGKFSEGMYQRSNVTLMGAKPEMSFNATPFLGFVDIP